MRGCGLTYELLSKDGIDFEIAKGLWLDENRIEIEASHPIENRYIIIGKLQGKLWTAVYTIREGAIRIISVRRSREKRQNYMKKKMLAKSTKEFDRRFDEGEDIHDLIDVSKATVVHHGKKVRITLDIAESLVNEIDNIRQRIGVDRGALIKVWLHGRVKQEKATSKPA